MMTAVFFLLVASVSASLLRFPGSSRRLIDNAAVTLDALSPGDAVSALPPVAPDAICYWLTASSEYDSLGAVCGLAEPPRARAH